jgi:hypothetical protein
MTIFNFVYKYVQDKLKVSVQMFYDLPSNVFYIFLGGIECVGHFFANVAHFLLLGDVWIRTQRADVVSRCATNLVTYLPYVCMCASLIFPKRTRTHQLPGTLPLSVFAPFCERDKTTWRSCGEGET